MWLRTPRWILIGGAWLAFTAGFVNAVGYEGVTLRGVSHVTGQVTQLGIELVRGEHDLAINAGILVLAFFVGAVLSGAIVRKPELANHRPYGIALVVESALLFAGAVLYAGAPRVAEVAVVVAMGLQNALASSWSGAVVRTTHVTGLVTDLGIICGRALRGEPVDGPRLKLLGLLFGSFAAGGVGGAVMFNALGWRCVVLPALWVLLMAAIFVRRQQAAGATAAQSPSAAATPPRAISPR